jgi:hypothetical protein
MSFEQIMRDAVREIAKEQGCSEDRAFAIWYAQVALRLGRIEAVDVTRFDGGNDRGIDLFYVDDESQRVVIAQTKYFKTSTKAPKPADVALALDALDALEDPNALRADGRADLAEASDDLEAAREQGYGVHIQIVYPGPARNGLESQVRRFNRTRGADDAGAELVVLTELEALYEDYVGSSGRVERGLLDVVGGAKSEAGTYGKAIVVTVTGGSLKALYDQHRNALFDQNVRLYLGARKGSVNADIRATIDDAKEQGNFWAYNNGITILADDFAWKARRSRVELERFSIVNGCQTTVLIGRSDPDAVAGVSVLARIVAAPAGIIDNIIRFTNSQTPIRIWEMSARDKGQQQLRRELDSLSPPWFYAFRRGEIPDRDRYGDPPRVLPFPESVQYLAAFRRMPVQAYKDKARLFTTHRERVVPLGLSPSEILWAWHIGEAVNAVLPTIRRELVGDPESELILKRGAAFYGTAIAAEFIRERNGPDFADRVPTSRLTDNAMRSGLQKYARQALVAHVRAMKNLLKSGRDLGLILRSPDTNAELERFSREEIVSLRGAPKALEEGMPLLPESGAK